MSPLLAGVTLLILVMAAADGCAAGPRPAADPPEPPAGWSTVTSDAGDVQLTLPPWLVPFDKTGAVFANEVVVGGGQGIELLAEGPGTAEPQPGLEGSAQRLERRIESPGSGVPVRSRVQLPAGAAVRVERVDHPGTPLAWRFDAYAIDTPRGTAFLLIDGPPDAWAGREDDIARITLLLRAGAGR
jgi:hypothetical protein